MEFNEFLLIHNRARIIKDKHLQDVKKHRDKQINFLCFIIIETCLIGTFFKKLM